MQIGKYAIIIICVGIFLILSLIGYLVETIKNNKNEISNEENKIKIEEIEDIEINKNKEIIPNIKLNKGDELLDNYDQDMLK